MTNGVLIDRFNEMLADPGATQPFRWPDRLGKPLDERTKELQLEIRERSRV